MPSRRLQCFFLWATRYKRGDPEEDATPLKRWIHHDIYDSQVLRLILQYLPPNMPHQLTFSSRHSVFAPPEDGEYGPIHRVHSNHHWIVVLFQRGLKVFNDDHECVYTCSKSLEQCVDVAIHPCDDQFALNSHSRVTIFNIQNHDSHLEFQVGSSIEKIAMDENGHVYVLLGIGWLRHFTDSGRFIAAYDFDVHYLFLDQLVVLEKHAVLVGDEDTLVVGFQLGNPGSKFRRQFSGHHEITVDRYHQWILCLPGCTQLNETMLVLDFFNGQTLFSIDVTLPFRIKGCWKFNCAPPSEGRSRLIISSNSACECEY